MHRLSQLFIFALVYFVFVWNFISVQCGGKEVHVNVLSTHTTSHHHLLHEALEYVNSEHGSQLYWKTLQALNEDRTFLHAQCTQSCQFDKLKHILHNRFSIQTKLLEWALATRHYTPVLHAFNQMAHANHSTFTPPYMLCDAPIAHTHTTVHIHLAKSSIPLFQNDHIFPTSHSAQTTNTSCVLYSSYDSQFFSFHTHFVKWLETNPHVSYAVRPLTDSRLLSDSMHRSSDNMKLDSLQGYLVELQIKNMEYKTLLTTDKGTSQSTDESAYVHGVNFDALQNDFPQLKNQFSKFEQHLKSQKHEDNIKIWDMKDFGIQTAYTVMQNQSVSLQLQTLASLSQNFPQHIQELSSLRVPEEFKRQLQNSRLQSGVNVVQLNGQQLDLDKLSIFTLYNLFVRESNLFSSFKNHWSPEILNDIPVLSKLYSMFLFKRPKLSTEHRFSIFHSSEENNLRTVLYLNNIETEPKYNRFPNHLSELLQPSHYGRLRWVRRHTFEALFVVDPSKRLHIQIVQSVLSLQNSGYPIRMGFIFSPGENVFSQEQEVNVDLTGAQTSADSPSHQVYSPPFDLCALLYYMHKTYGMQSAMQFLMQYVAPATHPSLNAITLQKAIAANDNTKHDITVQNDWSSIQSAYSNQLRYLHSTGLTHSGVPLLVLNGKIIAMTNIHPQHVPQSLLSHIQQDYPFIQSLISQGVLKDDTKDIQQAILEHTRALSNYHAQIFSKGPVYLPPNLLLSQVETSSTDDSVVTVRSLIDGTHDQMSVQFAYHVCFNMNEETQWNIASGLIKHISRLPSEKRSQYSFQFMHNQEKLNLQAKKRIGLFNSGFKSLDVNSSEFITELKQMLFASSFSEDEISPDASDARTHHDHSICSSWGDHLQQKKNSLREDSGPISTQSQTILLELNGRLIEVTDKFTMFDSLEQHEQSFVRFTEELISHTPSQHESPLAVSSASLTALVASDVAHSDRIAPPTFSQVKNVVQSCTETRHICIDSVAKTDARFEYPLIHAQLNPLSEIGATYTHILKEIYEHFENSLQIILNPVLEYTSLPLKSWYRFSFSPQLRFHHTEGNRESNNIVFDTFSTQNFAQILTMNVKPPETWLIETSYARYDLDNINLLSVSEDVIEARYQLKHIIISGSCFDDTLFTPPRGLQLFLDTPPNRMHAQDTLVMSNFGYFQLKANPGFHDLYIAPGKHSEVYQISSALVTDFYSQSNPIQSKLQSGEQIERISIPILHFEGPYVFLNVRRRPNQERTDLFDSPENSAGALWRSVKNRVLNSDEDTKSTVHIFSVATGHLYERLMRIMMLSVIRHTKRSKVKFWILGNYLSPQFKEILPQMAKDYGFEYGLVTYKWPAWLFKQTEKQRLIWAYKILFLDVLFPLDVKRIIFVDADQVSRTDMTELAEMDIQGRALAYTPFCSDRPEMEGYAFWTGGYWKNHLRGKPYHISALYLVDIQQLRKQYAADQYRSIYDNLARDPNSLSNLDQDLPNYAQQVVPIFSLPQHWLWCETWCSEKSKSKAKTIDLCNNPETKEHKTEAAKRIIPEWEGYDKEINVDYVGGSLDKEKQD
mmetsp:Transcript_9709/g.36075  ORF Transcript_9709/g.36075 Transcript_9709/m.36075 type:complete len:1560 (-) Transcript_9709:15-4694(-)